MWEVGLRGGGGGGGGGGKKDEGWTLEHFWVDWLSLSVQSGGTFH